MNYLNGMDQTPSSSFPRTLAITALMGLCFAIGVIVGQRVDPSETFIALNPETDLEPHPIAVMDTGEEHLLTDFSFYQVLSDSNTPIRSHNKAREDQKLHREPQPTPQPKVGSDQGDSKDLTKTDSRSKPSEKEATAIPPVAIPSPSTPSKNSDQTAKNQYTLQIGSHPSEESARAEMSTLRNLGITPYLMTINVPQKGTFYRVRVGHYPSLEVAREVQNKLQQDNNISSFVSPI